MAAAVAVLAAVERAGKMVMEEVVEMVQERAALVVVAKVAAREARLRGAGTEMEVAVKTEGQMVAAAVAATTGKTMEVAAAMGLGVAMGVEVVDLGTAKAAPWVAKADAAAVVVPVVVASAEMVRQVAGIVVVKEAAAAAMGTMGTVMVTLKGCLAAKCWAVAVAGVAAGTVLG